MQHRDPRHVFVYVSAEDRVLQYEVLNVNEFSSDRKRQSVVVRNQDGHSLSMCLIILVSPLPPYVFSLSSHCL